MNPAFIRCDAFGWNGDPIPVSACGGTQYRCCCHRCSSEPTLDEKFWSCAEHLQASSAKHERVRGRSADWKVDASS